MFTFSADYAHWITGSCPGGWDTPPVPELGHRKDASMRYNTPSRLLFAVVARSRAPAGFAGSSGPTLPPEQFVAMQEGPGE